MDDCADNHCESILRVKVWYARADESVDDRVLNQCRLALDDEELARHSRFVFAAGRQTFLVAHGLLRWALSQEAMVAPSEWSFTSSGSGKPLVDAPSHCRALQFSLTHTQGLVACAVAPFPVGIDAEWAGRRTSPELADRFFSLPEIAHLAALPEPEKKQDFLRIWTLKESYIKGTGLGLRQPLDQFWFEDLASHTPRIISLAAESCVNWRFARRDLPGTGHFLAAAAKAAPQATVRFELCEAVPFAGIVADTSESIECPPQQPGSAPRLD